jgi:hypothetical protein
MLWSSHESQKSKKMTMSEQLCEALDEVGGEPLQGSGFEDETPDQEFSETTLDAPEPPR